MATETDDCVILECCNDDPMGYSIEIEIEADDIGEPLALVAGPGAYVYGEVQDYPTHVAVSWDLQMSDTADGPWEDTGSATTFNDGEVGQFGDDPNFNKFFRVRFHVDGGGISDWSTNSAFR